MRHIMQAESTGKQRGVTMVREEARETHGRRIIGQMCRGPGLRLCLLNGFQLCDGDHEVELSWSARRLVALLALSDRPLPRGYVAGTLWLDLPESRSAANLRSLLWRLGRYQHQLVLSRRDHLQLVPQVMVDLHEAAAGARRLVGGQPAVDDGLDVEYLSRDLLPDWYDDWVTLERERFRQLRLHALEALCAHLTAAGLHARAIMAGLSAVAAEPLRETAQRALITAYAAEGNLSEALRQYASYRLVLQRDLGLEPTAQMVRLVADLTSR